MEESSDDELAREPSGCATMKRTHVPFDDAWRMQIDVRVSRAVRAGDLVFTCGQADLDAEGNPRFPGDLERQTANTMDHLVDVLERAGAQASDVFLVHAFHVSDGTVDEDRLRQAIESRFPRSERPLVALTPLPWLFYPGLEIEIDAVALVGAGTDTVERQTPWSRAARRGGLAAIEVRLQPRQCADAESLDEHLRGALASVGALPADLCRITAYAVGDARRLERALASVLQPVCEVPPVCTVVPVPRLGAGEEALRLLLFVARTSNYQPLPRERIGESGDDGWSRGVRVGSLVLLGGLQHPGGSTSEQTHAVMESVAQRLGAAGLSMSDVVKVNAYYAGECSAEALHENLSIRCGHYASPGPASTGMPVPRLAVDGAEIVVEVVAVDEGEHG